MRDRYKQGEMVTGIHFSEIISGRIMRFANCPIEGLELVQVAMVGGGEYYLSEHNMQSFNMMFRLQLLELGICLTD